MLIRKIWRKKMSLEFHVNYFSRRKEKIYQKELRKKIP